ncbi:MAG: putative Ig domain-containing protein, partial [Acidobacteriaceae bacterium]
GAPTAGGTASFTVTLTDAGSPGLTATAAYTLTTLYAPLSITTTALPNGVEGTTYSQQLTATGGNGVYTWTSTGTALSAVGLSLSSAGAITGTPNAGETSAPLAVTVTDTAGHTTTANLTLTVTSVAFQGQVLAGTTPVNGATIQLYAVGATGNASAAIPMLTQTVLSDPLGMFQLKGLYTCGQSNTGASIPATAQLYLVATGGIASSTSNASNSALTMVVAIGPCTTLTSTPEFTLNERTTAAAAWALAPFASSATNIGASSTNILGLTNAFLDAALLANPATGAPATLPTNLTVETGKLNALADALNSCTAGDGSTCTPLFTAATPTNGTTPTDTFTAALNITHHPGDNVAAVYSAISANGPTAPPFATTPLTQSPNDWTMSLTITGGGLSSPTTLGVDSLNNIWVANENSPLSAFNAQGTPLSTTGYGAGVIAQTYGLAIDTSNNIWVTNYNGNGGPGSVTEFDGITSSTPGASTSYGNGICYPYAAAADTNGNVFFANEECSSATILSPTGAVVSSEVGQTLGLNAKPLYLAVDTAHGFWLSDDDNTIAHISAPSTTYPNGQLLSHPDCCYNSHGVALDVAGNVWVANYLNSTISEVAPDGTVLINQQTVDAGAATPFAVVVDAAQNIWFTDLNSGSLLELSGPNSTTPGTELSPSPGVHSFGGFGLDASLTEPYSLAPDRSGNLWVSNQGQDALTMFFGLAAPTLTPLQPVPTAP